MSHNHGNSCNAENHDHDHGHGQGGEHTHDDDLMPAIHRSLYQYIDFDKIAVFNEAAIGTGKSIIKKTWDQRLDVATVLESDADEQLLIYVPFTGSVKLHSLLIRSLPSLSAPKTLKLFTNRDDIDFGAASEMGAVQTIELPVQPPGDDEIMEIPVKRALFNNVHSLTLFIQDNHSDGEEDVTILSYLAFKGSFSHLRKDAVIALYEAAANPADHKNIVPGAQYGSIGSGF